MKHQEYLLTFTPLNGDICVWELSCKGLDTLHKQTYKLCSLQAKGLLLWVVLFLFIYFFSYIVSCTGKSKLFLTLQIAMVIGR